jgi:hypothetical protein
MKDDRDLPRQAQDKGEENPTKTCALHSAKLLECGAIDMMVESLSAIEQADIADINGLVVRETPF